MLRSWRYLLSLLVGTNLSFHLLSLPAQAQVDEIIAPWRIESYAPGNLEPPDPVEVNSAALQDLLTIPGLTPDDAQRLIDWRQAHGRFRHDAEIRHALGLSAEEFEGLAPFLIAAADTTSYNLRITCRYRQENQDSFLPGTGPSIIGPKMSVTGHDGLFLGAALESESGESRLWQHSALAAALPLPGNTGRLILGDFLAGFGQGLVIRTARNYGLGRDGRSALSFGPQGLKPYFGWSQDLALRGAAVQAHYLTFEVTTWGSSRERGVTLDSAGIIHAFNQSILDQSRETSWGGRGEAGFLSRRLKAGITIYQMAWDHPLLLDSVTQTHAGAAGIDLSWSDSTLSAGVEAAWDDRGRSAQSGMVDWHGGPWILQQAIYRVDPDYFSPLASGIDMGLGEVRNRQGSFSSLAYQFRRATIFGFMHLYRYPRRQPGQSWGGQDLSMGAESPLGSRVKMRVTSRWLQEQDPDTVAQISRWRGTGSISATAASGWRLLAGIQLCKANSMADLGQMLRLSLSTDVPIGEAGGLGFSLSAGLYQAKEYANRLYWNEAGLGGSLKARPVWGNGQAVQIIISGWRRSWGQVGLALWWDQPEAGGPRIVDREFSAVYRYP